MTAVALSKLPAVVCPDWCTIPGEEQVADLRNWEGFVIHWSAEVGGVRHAEMAYADGLRTLASRRGSS